MDRLYYSLPQVAKMLGVHPHTLRKWVDAGKVPAMVLPSGIRRFTAEQLDQIKIDLGIVPKLTAAA